MSAPVWHPASTAPAPGDYIVHYELDPDSPLAKHAATAMRYVHELNYGDHQWRFLDSEGEYTPIAESGLRAIEYCAIPQPPVHK